MEPYVLKVVRSDDPESPADVSVTDAVVSDVRRLFTEICRNIVSAELRLQGDVPERLYAYEEIDGASALAQDARRFMDETLDYLGGSSRGTYMDDTYPDVLGRKRIARIVRDLSSHLEGNVLLHGYGEEPSEYRGSDLIWITGMAQAVTRAYGGGLIGVVVKDPARKGHWVISNGRTSTPLNMVTGLISRYDVEDFAAAGPVIAKGTIVRDEEDNLVELKALENCYTFPGAVFLRAIGDGRNLGLVAPLVGVPGHYARTGTWYLKCEDLGIEASGDCWDSCVEDFHRRFLDLWTAHSEGRGENARIHAMLDEMCPFDA